MTEPKRIQRKRSKGWRMPEDAIYVGRGSAYGNPFRAYQHCRGGDGDWGVEDTGRFNLDIGHGWTKTGALKFAIHAYRAELMSAYPPNSTAFAVLCHNLAGHDLACWCPLDQPCHADVLLEIANQPEPAGGPAGDDERRSA